MKKLILNLALLAVTISAISFQSCKKDDTTTAKTNKELLQGFKWKLTAETTDGQDSFGDYSACSKDDTKTFGTDNKVVTDEGATKCDPTDPQTTTNTYSLSSDQKTISVKDAATSISIDFTIVSISETTLKLQYNFLGTTVETYTRQ